MNMKRTLFLVVVLLLTGCGNKEERILYDDEYYKIATPYKKEAGSYSIESYDKISLESMLMNVSKSYFNINDSLYQSGQILTSIELKNLINNYNETESITIDNVLINPKYLISIYEQNYLDLNNELKGVSIALVLSDKQYYTTTNYKKVDSNIVLEYGINISNLLVKYLREKTDKEIVIALYLNDGIKYIGSTKKDSIKFDYINYNVQVLDSNYILNNDTNNYNNYIKIKKALEYDSNIYISGKGLYKNDYLESVDIIVTKSYFKNEEILNIFNLIVENINFDIDKEIKVYLKSNNELRAFLNKKRNELKVESYILEG